MPADDNIIQILLQAKDLASEAIKRLQDNIGQLPQTTDEVGEAFKALKISSTEDMEEQKNVILSAFDAIKNSGTASAQEIQRAEAAKNKALADLSRENFETQQGFLDSLKNHYIAISATIIVVWAAINKAADWAKLGAEALQTEEAFRNVADSYDVDGDRLLAKMKEVSAGVIDDSNLMQRALKALQQGLNPDQIIQLLEVARSSARIAGTDIASAFDGITNAVANQTTRALKLYGIVIDNNKAFEDYAKVIGVSKDALTEQQQSQALANATIAEGQRQMKAMGEITLNASERIQQAEAQLHELKETIGKGIIVVVQAGGGAFYEMAAAALYLTGGLLKVAAAGAYVSLQFDTAKELNKSAEIAFQAAAETAEKGLKLWDGISMSTANAAESTKGLAKQQRDAAEAAAMNAEKQRQAAEMAVTLKEQEIKTLEAATAYEIALEKQRYDEGKISLHDYISFVKSSQEKHVQEMIKLKELELAALKTDTSIIDSERVKKAAEIEGEIQRIKLQSKTDQLKIEAELTADLKKEQQSAFDNWKNLQEMKLQTLKSNLDLQNAIDDAAVKAGTMRESEAMANKLDRYRQFAEEQIRVAQETADRIAEMEAQGLYKTEAEREQARAEYEKAIAQRETLQLQLQQTIVSSEQQIAETQKKEVLEAEEFIAGILDDKWRKEEADRQKSLDQLEEYYQQGLISAEDYYDALDRLQEESVSEFKSELRERSEQLNQIVDIIQERTQRMTEAISNFVGDNLDDIKWYFGDARKAIATDLDDVEKDVGQFLKTINSGSYQTFWSATLLGRSMAQMVGTSIYDWAQRVTNYIQYVKGLMDSLKEKIMSYQDELDSLRGNETAIVDRWYQVELAKLKAQFADLENTEEYYKALEKLDELYREKRKRAEEEEAAAKEQQREDQKTKDSGGSSGGLTGSATAAASYPSLEDFAKQLQQDIASDINTLSLQNYLGGVSFPGVQESTAKQETNISASFDMRMIDDPATMDRWMRDMFWPSFVSLLRVKGINIDDLSGG